MMENSNDRHDWLDRYGKSDDFFRVPEEAFNDFSAAVQRTVKKQDAPSPVLAWSLCLFALAFVGYIGYGVLVEKPTIFQEAGAYVSPVPRSFHNMADGE